MPPEPPTLSSPSKDTGNGTRNARLWQTPESFASEALKGGRIGPGSGSNKVRFHSAAINAGDSDSDGSLGWRSKTYPPPASRPLKSSPSTRRQRVRQPENPPERPPERSPERSPQRSAGRTGPWDGHGRPGGRPKSAAGTGDDHQRRKRGFARGAAADAGKKGICNCLVGSIAWKLERERVPWDGVHARRYLNSSSAEGKRGSTSKKCRDTGGVHGIQHLCDFAPRNLGTVSRLKV